MPQLLDVGKDSFAVMDTAAVVYLRSGDLENAKVWMDKAIKYLKKNNYSTAEVQLNAAELHIRRGEFDAARTDIDALRQDSSRTDFIDQRARGLIRDIESLRQ